MPANLHEMVREAAGFAAAQALALQSLRQSTPDRDRQSLAGQPGDFPRKAVCFVILEVQGHRSSV